MNDFYSEIIRKCSASNSGYTQFNHKLENVISKNISEFFVQKDLSATHFIKYALNEYGIIIDPSVISRSRYMHERGDASGVRHRVTPGMMLLFCQYTGIRFEELLIPDRFKVNTGETRISLKPLLASLLGDNRRFVYNMTERGGWGARAMGGIFTDGESESLLHTYYLSLDERSASRIVKGELTFRLDADGCCLADLHLPRDTNGQDSHYNGFAVIADNRSHSPICYCILRQSGPEANAEVLFITFQVQREGFAAYVAQLSGVRSKTGKPVTLRMILAKQGLRCPEECHDYLEGCLMMSGYRYVISEESVNHLSEYLSPSENGLEIENKALSHELNAYFDRYFENLRQESHKTYKGFIKSVLNQYMHVSTVKYVNVRFPRLDDVDIEYDVKTLAAILISWVMKRAVTSHRINEASSETEDMIEILYDWMRDVNPGE
jgi:hypothetical protein